MDWETDDDMRRRAMMDLLTALNSAELAMKRHAHLVRSQNSRHRMPDEECPTDEQVKLAEAERNKALDRLYEELSGLTDYLTG